MVRTLWTLLLGFILAAAASWLLGSGVRAALRSLGEPPQYAADVGGLTALAAFLLLVGYVVFRVGIGGRLRPR